MIKIQSVVFALALVLFAQHSIAQNEDFEDSMDSEVEAVDPLPKTVSIEESPEEKQKRLTFEAELQRQESFRRSKGEQEIKMGENVNRYPHTEPMFKKPVGPKQGGVVRVPHPSAEKGLLRIESDGTYRYKTKVKEKSQSSSFRFSSMTPPKISSSSGSANYESMYGSGNATGATFNYEWQPFRGFGSLGLIFETGLFYAQGNGTFKNTNRPEREAREVYTLYTIPLGAFVNYRFEYVKHQWVVPFVYGGGIYYGLLETRDDGNSTTVAGTPAVGGGGGVHLSITRLDQANAFTLSEEYDIADMWLTIEARAMQGLSEEIDYTNQSINVGITVDY